MLIVNEKQKIKTYCKLNVTYEILLIIQTTPMCFYIYMNGVARHTHTHAIELSEMKWEQFQIQHNQFPLLAKVSQDDTLLQETAGIWTPAWKPVVGNFQIIFCQITKGENYYSFSWMVRHDIKIRCGISKIISLKLFSTQGHHTRRHHARRHHSGT